MRRCNDGICGLKVEMWKLDKHTSLITSFPLFSPVNSSYASSSSSGLIDFVCRREGSGFRRMGETGVESSSTAKVFMEGIEELMKEFLFCGALVVLAVVGGEIGVAMLYMLLFRLRRGWRQEAVMEGLFCLK